MRAMSVARHGLVSTVILTTGLLLSSCGFRPLYGRSTAQPDVSRSLASVEIAPISDRMGQMLRTALKRRLTPYGARVPTLYTLKIQLREAITKVAIDKASFATRANLRVTANFRLLRNQDNKQITAGNPFAVASYNILNSDFATLAARADARKRAVENLADDIHTRLAIVLRTPTQNRDIRTQPKTR